MNVEVECHAGSKNSAVGNGHSDSGHPYRGGVSAVRCPKWSGQSSDMSGHCPLSNIIAKAESFKNMTEFR